MAGQDIQYAVTLMDLWIVGALLLLILPTAALAGWYSGRQTYIAKSYDTNPPNSYPGESTGGAMLALLGLLLAFTFSFALTHFEKRKAAQLEEALAIGTAFLNADLLGSPGTDLQRVLADYTATRLADAVLNDPKELEAFLQETIAAQAKIWPTMMAAFSEETPPAIVALNVGGITDVLDAHSARLAAAVGQVPQVAKIMLLLCAIMALFFIGNNSALRGRNLSWRTFTFSAALASLMIVILDFERPRTGLIRLDNSILEITLADMQTSLSRTSQE